MKKYRTADTILRGTGIEILYAVIIIQGIINNKDKSLSLIIIHTIKRLSSLAKIILQLIRKKHFLRFFLNILKIKKHLNPDSLKDIKKLSSAVCPKSRTDLQGVD